MSYSATRRKRFTAGVLAGAMAFTVMPILGFTGTAGAAHYQTADPIGNGNVCEDAPETDPFTDVSDTDFAVEEIRCMVNTEPQITKGKTATTYEPNSSTLRGQMALFLQRVADLAEANETSEDAIQALPAGDGVTPFTDIGDWPAEHQSAIDRLEEADITEGVTPTEFRPEDPVTRRQMAKFLVRLQNYLAGADFAPAVINDCTDCFTDDQGDTGEDELNILAREGVFIGTGVGEGHNVDPGANITRRQMAFVLTRKLEVLFESGLITRLFAEDDTNQTFTVTPGEETTARQGENREFTVTDITSDTVDIALVPCANVTVTDGVVTFADAENQGAGNNEADLGTVPFADITTVNRVSSNFGDFVDEEPATDGTVTVTVETTGEGCFVLVVFDDADDDDALDLDANNQPTEDFAVSGRSNVVAPAFANAEPEFALNSFGDLHQVTAQVENAAGDDVALSDVRVRFTVFRQGTNTTGTPVVTDVGGDQEAEGGAGNECAELTNPQQVETSTTDNAGLASFSYTVQDPRPNTTNDRIGDCIRVEADLNADGTFDSTDFVAKNWTDEEAAAAALDLEPDLDSNPVGTRHTVTATAADQFGNPAAGERVKFEVYVDAAPTEGAAQPAPADPIVEGSGTTAADGTVSFTYAGPAATAGEDSRDDVIVACISDGDCITFTETAAGPPPTGTVAREQPSDEARKIWVENAAATDARTGEVAGFDTAADFVDVDAATNRRFQYDANDTFFVACSTGTLGTAAPRNMGQFEDALSEGDAIQVTAEDAQNNRQFSLVDEDDSSTFCP